MVSLIQALSAVGVLAWLLVEWRGGAPISTWVYIVPLALFHGIYAIWHAKGAALAPFQLVSAVGRSLNAVAFGLSAARMLEDGGEMAPLLALHLPVYLCIAAFLDLSHGLSGIILHFKLRRAQQDPSSAGAAAGRGMAEWNRLLFAIYMIGLAAWILAAPASFLDFFRLPPDHFVGRLLAGPLPLLAWNLILLSAYNLCAVAYRLTPLIEAGKRGGLFTCFFFAALVALGILHPITLLLPAVDLLSIALLLLSALWKRRAH